MEPTTDALAQFLELGFAAAGAMITALDLRVKTMNNEVVRIDTLISTVVGVRPDLDRIARADGQKDARKD